MRADPALINSHPLTPGEFPHLTNDLLRKFSDCESFEKAIELYKNRIQTLGLEPNDVDEKVSKGVRIIEERRGEIKVSELARAVELSVRQLERRFRKSAGLSPKQFARARRIRATAINLVEEADLNWAGRAAEMGFTDQAHLSREFSSLTGRSPNSFAEKVKRIEHGNIIK